MSEPSADRVHLPEGVSRVLITPDQIRKRVDDMAKEIARDMQHVPELLVLGVLNGSLIFLADLVRRLPLRVRYDMIRAASYRGTQSTGEVRIEASPDPDQIRGRDVLLVDQLTILRPVFPGPTLVSLDERAFFLLASIGVPTRPALDAQPINVSPNQLFLTVFVPPRMRSHRSANVKHTSEPNVAVGVPFRPFANPNGLVTGRFAGYFQ